MNFPGLKIPLIIYLMRHFLIGILLLRIHLLCVSLAFSDRRPSAAIKCASTYDSIFLLLFCALCCYPFFSHLVFPLFVGLFRTVFFCSRFFAHIFFLSSIHSRVFLPWNLCKSIKCQPGINLNRRTRFGAMKSHTWWKFLSFWDISWWEFLIEWQTNKRKRKKNNILLDSKSESRTQKSAE